MRTIYDPIFVVPPQWTTPAREAPFRARGVVYQRDIARIERTVNGGLEAVIAAAGNPHLAAFFHQSFSAHRWYDVIPLTLLLHAGARLRGVTLTQFARDAVDGYVEAAFSGVSGLVLRSVSLEAVATWLPKASSWFNDFGTTETRVAGDRLVRSTRTQLPAFMVHAWAVVAIEFTEVALRRCGASEVRIYPLAVEDDGEREGHRLFRVSFEIAWTP